MNTLAFLWMLTLRPRDHNSPTQVRWIIAVPIQSIEFELSRASYEAQYCSQFLKFDKFELSKALYEAPNRCFSIKFDKFELSKALYEAQKWCIFLKFDKFELSKALFEAPNSYCFAKFVEFRATICFIRSLWERLNRLVIFVLRTVYIMHISSPKIASTTLWNRVQTFLWFYIFSYSDWI